MSAKRKLVFFGLVLVVSFLPSLSATCFAAEARNLEEELSRLIKLVEEQGKHIQEQQQMIDEFRARIAPPPVEKPPADAVVGSQPAPAGAQPTPMAVSQEPVEATTPVGIPPEKAEKRLPEIATVFDQPGILTSKGSLVLEPSLQYSYSSNNRIALFGYTIIPAITIGVIDVRQINSDSLVTALTARYGLTNRLELEAKVPYVFRSESTITRPSNIGSVDEDVFDQTDSGIGDIELGVRYQINQPTTGPFYIASLRVKSDTGQGPYDLDIDPQTQMWTELATGSGFWAVQPGLTVIYPTDPAVFFGGINYLWHIEDDKGDYGTVDPGDVVGVSFGMGMAINEKASFSLGYEHNVIATSRVEGEKLPGDTTVQVGTLSLGYSYVLSKKTNISLTLGVGVTEYSPDVQLTIRIPFTL